MSKRRLGILATAAGLLLLAAVLLFDSLGMSDPDAGFGPSQKLGLVAAIGLVAVGLSLLPLGDTPA